MLYERLLRPLLFGLDAERVHEAVTGLAGLAGSSTTGRAALEALAGPAVPGLETEFLGLKFPNPIGVAAGFDKDCRLLRALPCLGFGFVEAGSITLRPQPGNPKPRLFRVPEARAVVNRMGFNGAGARACAERLAALGRPAVPLGINLGLNKDCPKERAAAEYAECFKLLEPFGGYFVVNVSSPNTPGLRALQDRLQLERILGSLAEANPRSKPILVKIDPDLQDEPLADLVALVRRSAAGLVVSNTTLSREGLPPAAASLEGGLSGAPLRRRSTELIRKARELSEGRLPIIGVGGVFTGADAYEKLRAGAGLVQLYSGLVYRGPRAARLIQAELAECLRRDGLPGPGAASGSDPSLTPSGDALASGAGKAAP